MKKHSPLIKRLLSILSVFAVLMAFSVMGFSAAAEDHIVIAIHNNGAEVHDNPIIRTFLPKDIFGSGGPFTVKAEYKVENLKKQSAKNDPIMLFDIYTKESMGANKTQDQRQITIKEDTNGWQELKANEGKASGNYVTFNNVDRLPMGSDMPEYYLLNFALCRAKGDLYVRNLRIENAAGQVVYSWDTDEDLNALLEGKDKADLNDIGQINPEAMNVATGFGSGPAAQFTVSRGDADMPEPSDGPQYENPTDAPNGGDSTTTAGNNGNGGGSNNTTTAGNNAGTTDPAGSDTPSTSEGETTTGDGTTVTTDQNGSNSNTPAGVTTVPNASTPDGEGGGLGAGWIVLIVVGGLIVAAGIAFGVLFALKKLPFQKTGDGSDGDVNPPQE